MVQQRPSNSVQGDDVQPIPIDQAGIPRSTDTFDVLSNAVREQTIPLKTTAAFSLPSLGFGCSGLGAKKDGSHSKRDPANDDGADIQRVKSALACGFRHFDLAEVYAEGHAERLVGEALRMEGVPREQLFLATKVLPSNVGYEALLKSVRGSLERLQTTYLDILYLHSPNHEIDVQETARALRTLVERGEVRAVGASNHSVESLEALRNTLGKNTAADVKVVQAHYSLRFREPETSGLLAYCQQEDILFCAWRPLERGALHGQQSTELSTICQNRSLTPAMLSLSWLLSQSHVVAVTSTGSQKHLVENIAATRNMLSAPEVELLRATFPDQVLVDPKYPLT